MATVALATASFKPAVSWNSSDMNNIIRAGQIYYENCISYQNVINSEYDENFLNAIHLLQDVEINNRKINVFVNLTECRGGQHVEGVFVDAIKNFEFCQFTYGIITYNENSYGLLRLQNANGSSSYAFFDSHGRKHDGSRPGSKSAILFFENDSAFINFFLSENHLLSPLSIKKYDNKSNLIIVPLHFIDIGTDQVIDSIVSKGSTIFTKVISGSFAQNDIRFDNESRNKQRTANSVIFLAFTSILKQNITSVDLDSILTIGDQIYKVSYREAIKLRSEITALTKSQIINPYLAAHEVQKHIFVNIARFNIQKFKVSCQPLSNKEYSGNFNNHAKTYIERFFKEYDNGIFICSSLSIALHKMHDMYVIFDPHERSVNGLAERHGKSNIFFFSNIQLLCEYLRASDYEMSHDFTLTPFIISHGNELHQNFSCTTQSLIFANRFTKIHKDCRKIHKFLRIFLSIFVNLCESVNKY